MPGRRIERAKDKAKDEEFQQLQKAKEG